MQGLHSTRHLQHPTQELAVRVAILTIWLVSYSNDVDGKDYMLISINTVNSAWFARERRL